MRHRPLIPVFAALLLVVACVQARNVGMPGPVRPDVLSVADAQSTFRSLSSLMEARGFPILVADTSFGFLRTEWVEWDAGEVDLRDVADCDASPESPPYRTRARFAFEVRARAHGSFVTIISHWQMEKHAGFDESDRGFTDCTSTGEWERAMEEMLTQRRAIR